jgi:hypothetical protein
MVAVTGHKGVLTKGLNCEDGQIWQFWPKIGLSTSNFHSSHVPLLSITTKTSGSTAIHDKILTMSQLPKQGDEYKILSGVSQPWRGVNLI